MPNGSAINLELYREYGRREKTLAPKQGGKAFRQGSGSADSIG
jgi:hypothetical protein